MRAVMLVSAWPSFSNPSITNENRFNTHSEELEQRIPSNALIESAPASALSC